MKSDNFESVTQIAKNILSIKSYSGEEYNVANKLKEIYEELGFDEVYIDEYGSITAMLNGNRPGKKILLDAHIDTVPVPDETMWSTNPFCATEKNGKIYARGASDMKGALASMIAGVSAFIKNRDFSGQIYISGVVHEECFEGVASRIISKRVKPDYVIIGESTQLDINRGQRGRAEVVVETYGKPAHSANPEKGVNAVYMMSKFIEELQHIVPKTHPFLGNGIYVLTDIKSSPYPGASVVPDYCKITLDRRLLVNETKESVLFEIQTIINKLTKQVPNFKAKTYFSSGEEKCYTGNIIKGERFFPAWLYDENDELVSNAVEGLKQVGINPKIRSYSFCTNGSHYAGEAQIKTIGFGPSFENLAHTIDEYIETEQLILAAKGYYAIIKNVLK